IFRIFFGNANHYPKDFFEKFVYTDNILGDQNVLVILENGSDFHHIAYRHDVLIPYIARLKFTFDESYGPDMEAIIRGRITIYLLGFQLVTVPFMVWHLSPVLGQLSIGTENSFLGTVVAVATTLPLQHDGFGFSDYSTRSHRDKYIDNDLHNKRKNQKISDDVREVIIKNMLNGRKVTHELLHALGFNHEHSRPDRDDYVQVIMSNVKLGIEHNFEKRSCQCKSVH
ncbi:unnamed protein product, partial [Medioppia subpectinata]